MHKEQPWCPQCKAPFSYLLTYRNLDGSLQVCVCVCVCASAVVVECGVECVWQCGGAAEKGFSLVWT